MWGSYFLINGPSEFPRVRKFQQWAQISCDFHMFFGSVRPHHRLHCPRRHQNGPRKWNINFVLLISSIIIFLFFSNVEVHSTPYPPTGIEHGVNKYLIWFSFVCPLFLHHFVCLSINGNDSFIGWQFLASWEFFLVYFFCIYWEWLPMVMKERKSKALQIIVFND